MHSADRAPLSSLMAVRKIVTPSKSLKELLKTAASLVEETEPVQYLLDPLVYAADGLRVTIFERRIKAGIEANDLLRKVQDRLESPTLITARKIRQPSGKSMTTTKKRPNPLPEALREVEALYVPPENGLTVRANRIVACTKPHLGTEFALVIDDGAGASALEAQHDMLMDAEMRMVAGRKLRKLAEDQAQTDVASSALLMPFMRAPLEDDYQRVEFIEMLSADLPVHDIEIGPIVWKRNTIS